MSRSNSSPFIPTGSRSAARRHGAVASLGVAATALLAAAVAWSGSTPAYAAEATVGMGTAASYAVLAGSEVTNTGPSTISGDLGVSPGTAVTGFPPGTVSNGTIHSADAAALQAKDDLTTAYNDAAGRSTTEDVTGTDLGGRTLVSGVYTHTSGMQLTGTVTLDAEGDPNAVFIFQAGSTLVTASGATVSLINGASACNVFWQVGSSATLGTGTQFVGTIMALTSASLTTGADVQGRVLARNGAVTLDTNDITVPACAGPTTTPTPTPTVTPTGTGTPSPSPTGTAGPGGGGSSATPTATSTQSPVVPLGNPDTGATPGPGSTGPWFLLGLATLAATGAVVAFARVVRTPRRH